MFGLGAGELLLIGVFALIFIGPKKLPELARGLGASLREFQKAKDDFMNEVKNEENALDHSDQDKLPTGVHTATNDEESSEAKKDAPVSEDNTQNS